MIDDSFDALCDVLQANIDAVDAAETSPSLTEMLSLANLTLKDLEGIDLSEVDLRGANLQGADLREARLEGANLQGVDLSGANLGGVNMENALVDRHTAESLGYRFIPTDTKGVVQLTSKIGNVDSQGPFETGSSLLELIEHRVIAGFLRISDLMALEDVFAPTAVMVGRRSLRPRGHESDVAAAEEGLAEYETPRGIILRLLASLPSRWVPFKTTMNLVNGTVSIVLYDKREGRWSSTDYGELRAVLPDVKDVQFDAGSYGKAVKLDRLGAGRMGLQVRLKLDDASLQYKDFGLYVDGEGEHGLKNLRISLR